MTRFNGKSWMTECQDVVDLLYNSLYNKSKTDRSNGVCAYAVGERASELDYDGRETDGGLWMQKHAAF